MHFIVIVILWLGFAIQASAATYYVGKNVAGASDSNAGTSAVEPWLTVQKSSTTATSGDTVFVLTGDYAERVTISNHGATFAGNTNDVTILGVTSTGKDNWSLIGFQITHPSVGAQNYDAVRVDGGTNVKILDNYIHDVDSSGIRPGNTLDLIIRGNVIDRCGQASLPLTGAAGVSSLFGKNDTNTVVEYNSISHVSDYINPFGTGWKIRNNLIGPCYTNATVHIDGIQPNAKCDLGLFENTMSIDNSNSDNHFFLNQYAESTNWVLRGNVTIRSKGIVNLQGGMKTYFYHNSFIDNLVYYDSDFQINMDDPGHFSRGNIWWKSVKSTPGPYTPNANIDDDGDIWYQSGTQTQANGLSSDPLIVSTNDAHIQVSSPAIGSAIGVTIANGAGSSSMTLVTASGGTGSFYAGDEIKIGSGDLVSVESVDLTTDTIMLAVARSWSDGDDVWWRGQTDIGALPYGSVELTAAVMVQSGTTYTVTPTGDARGVWFYVDGIPTTWVSTAPYSAMIASGTVTAKAYALYAQSEPVVSASFSPTPQLNGNSTISGNVTFSQ